MIPKAADARLGLAKAKPQRFCRNANIGYIESITEPGGEGTAVSFHFQRFEFGCHAINGHNDDRRCEEPA